MNRRTWVVGTLTVAGVKVVHMALSGDDKPQARSSDDPLVMAIEAACAGLVLEPGAIAAYVADLQVAGPLAPRNLEPVRRFLLSTDLFTRKYDAIGAVRYIGLYDPYRGACRNPLWVASQPGGPT